MKSYTKPTNDQLEAAMPLLSSPQHEVYFFSHLENPLWITPLAEHGVFKYPPKAEDLKEGGVRFPNWPPSRYLARMAPQAPAEVATIFVAIETDNASIVGDMIVAAQAMPTEIAIKLVPNIRKAAKDGTLWFHFKDACDLCVRLAGDGKVDAALSLAVALFTPRFDEGQETPSRREEYWYKDGLKKVVPVLAVKKPKKFLPKLCDWLKASIQAKDRDRSGDYSYVWRPAIEEDERNKDYDFAGVMVGFVREGFERAVDDGQLPFTEALAIVESYQHLIFKRLRIHLINVFADKCTDLAREEILNQELFDDYQYKHEYAMLVGRRLDLLTQEEQDKWFEWIDAGPDISDPDATDEDRQSEIKYWQFEKLHCVRNHLHGKRREFYDQMLAEHSEPQLADVMVSMEFGRGSKSPMTVDDLSEMTFQQAVETVSSWQTQKHGFMEPDIKALGSTFEQYVATNPEEFSAEAHLLVNRPAIFVRCFISQMIAAIKAGCEINLPAVTELSRWVVGRPVNERTTVRQEHERLVDKNWQWTRDEISRFIENICRATDDNTSKYPLGEYRKPIWSLLDSLCRDMALSYMIRDESQDDPRVQDYLDFSINSPRGKAVEAALEYAHWVADHIKESDDTREVVPGGFDAMPEIREMLEWQISPENRSFEALAMIGSRIDLIYWIDKQWLTENADRLFSLQDVEREPATAHGWAAWNAFLVWCRPHKEFYRIFKSQFAYAVDRTAEVNATERSRANPMHRLGEHLMILYGQGILGLHDDDLLPQFLRTSIADIRRHAITFVGEALGDNDSVPTEIIERFEKLWEFYWSRLGKKDAKEAPDAWLFGTWFSCGRFPEQWALDHLHQFVEVNPMPGPDHAIANKLAEIANIDVVRSVLTLDTMVRGDREGWRISGWDDQARQILNMAMKADQEARTVAVELINYLGRRGHTEFGDVLP